jgi:hypothetical protein
VRVHLNGVAQAFPAGHRIRLSLSTSYWPLAWPPPRPVRMSVFTGTSRLELPIRPTAETDEVTPHPFDEPEGAPPIRTTRIRPGEERWTVSRDLVTYQSELRVVKDSGVVRFDDLGHEVGRHVYQRYGWVADDFESVCGKVEATMSFRRDGWDVHTVTSTVLTCTGEDFLLHARLDGFEGERRVYSRNWVHTVPRDLL